VKQNCVDGTGSKKIEKVYDKVAAEYAETFSNEHVNKPKDREILHRFSREIGDKKSVLSLFTP